MPRNGKEGAWMLRRVLPILAAASIWFVSSQAYGQSCIECVAKAHRAGFSCPACTNPKGCACIIRVVGMYESCTPCGGHLVLLLQGELKLRNPLPGREGRTINGKAFLREDDFVSDFSVTKVGDKWRLDISPDPDDRDLPNAVEIIGRDWRLVHHIHGVDTGDTIVAHGHY
jgi:hypothetical protein